MKYSLLLFIVFFCQTCFAQKIDAPFSELKSEKTEYVNIGGLYDLEFLYSFTLNENGLNLDTVIVDENQIFGYKVVNVSFQKNQISEFHYDYELYLSFQKTHLNRAFFSQVIKVYASIYIEGESSENFSVINEITNADQIIPSFIVCQHIWQYHYWLLIVSVLVLLFKGTPINARHGLIFIFPLLGPAVYLAKQVVILVRKRKESRKTEQSMQHPQSAMHAPES